MIDIIHYYESIDINGTGLYCACKHRGCIHFDLSPRHAELSVGCSLISIN